jgi:hypothetical protein
MKNLIALLFCTILACSSVEKKDTYSRFYFITKDSLTDFLDERAQLIENQDSSVVLEFYKFNEKGAIVYSETLNKGNIISYPFNPFFNISLIEAYNTRFAVIETHHNKMGWIN